MACVLNLVQPHCFQEKLYREVKENSNASNEDFALEWQDFGNYKYTEMVVKETLRLFPIGPMVLRHITQDLHLKNHVVPAGSSLMITMFRTHRLPEIWPEPDKFIPERFLPELNASRHPYAFVPFSAGPRSCIGKFMIASCLFLPAVSFKIFLGSKYAMLAIRTIVIHVIKNFRVSCDRKYEDLKIKCDISIRSLDGYNVKLVPR